ncbi:hypothetical protein GX441_06310 [bacterium]|nr:hypothetical protein [bacterium]
MGQVHVINVVHTEHNWWDDGYTGLDEGTALLLERFANLGARHVTRIPITWCLYFGNGEKGPVTGTVNPDIIDVRKEFFRERFKLGDEIGIHTHASDPKEQPRFFKANAEKVESHGFPYPKTHAPAWFYLDGSIFRALEAARIEIDTGVLVGCGVVNHPRVKDLMVQDSSRRDRGDHRAFRPYHPDYEKIWEPGTSPIVEIPVFLSCEGIGENPARFIEAFRKLWEHRDEVAVDIVQFFWHPFECMEQRTGGRINHSVIDGWCTLYSEIASWNDIVFSTACDAVVAWKWEKKKNP